MTTTTISREQHGYAWRGVREAGPRGPRHACCSTTTATSTGSYDKLVSIEMIEAVGWQDFGTFFASVLATCSRPTGSMLLQAITIDDRAYEVEKRVASFIRTLVFPNGCLPSLEVIARCVARAHRPADRRTSRTSRRTTPRRCGAGARTSTAAAERLEELGYDERFRRLWRLYLAYCEAGFAERRIGLTCRCVLAKPRWRPRPRRRAGRRRRGMIGARGRRVLPR